MLTWASSNLDINRGKNQIHMIARRNEGMKCVSRGCKARMQRLNYVPMKSLFLSAIVTAACFATGAQSQSIQPPTRLAVIGDFSSVQVGQAGFCGARRAIPSTQFRAIGLTPGEPAWVRVRDAQSRPTTPGASTCEADAGFVPEAGQSYILRLRAQTTTCTAELFRLVPGGDPVRATLSPPPSEDCPKKP